MAELNLWLDSYDDIYSDFDSRHYLKRRISEDFLQELRTEMKAIDQQAGEIVLFLPAEMRVKTIEDSIVVRLKEYFESQFIHFQDKYQSLLKKGILLLVIGIVIMLANTWIAIYFTNSIAMISIKVILEPAGWFLLWAAFDYLFYDLALLKKERKFYNEINKLKILFKST